MLISKIHTKIVITLVLIGLDLVSKYIAAKFLEIQWNTGIAFSIGSQINWSVVTAVILLAMYYLQMKSTEKAEVIAYTLLVAGGTANLVDRVSLGAVRDFIYYPILQVYGNLADIFVFCGVMLILLKAVTESIHTKQLRKVTHED